MPPFLEGLGPKLKKIKKYCKTFGWKLATNAADGSLNWGLYHAPQYIVTYQIQTTSAPWWLLEFEVLFFDDTSVTRALHTVDTRHTWLTYRHPELPQGCL